MRNVSVFVAALVVSGTIQIAWATLRLRARRLPEPLLESAGDWHALSLVSQQGFQSVRSNADVSVESFRSNAEVSVEVPPPKENMEDMCEKYFSTCWEPAGLKWSVNQSLGCASTTALNARATCGNLLCNSWTKTKCEAADSEIENIDHAFSRSDSCDEVAKMCKTRKLERAFRLSRYMTSGSYASLSTTRNDEDIGSRPLSGAAEELRLVTNAFGNEPNVKIDQEMSAFMGQKQDPPPEPLWLGANSSSLLLRNLTSLLATSYGNEPPLRFMHIPKNAGSAIEEAGKNYGINWGVHEFPGQVRMRDGFLCHKYHAPPGVFESKSIHPYASNTSAFCVVRNPYQRILSEYRYLLQVSWGEAWSPGIHDGHECTAKGLNNWLQSVLTRFQQGERYINDCHMLPQMEYIQANSRRYARWELGEVLRWEDLPDAFNKLMESRGMAPRLNTTSWVNGHHQLCPELGFGDFSNESKKMIHTAYYEDFTALGYEMK